MPHQPHTEKELLTRIANGDQSAFNTIFTQYRDPLYYFLIRIIKSPEVVEEIITDIFMKLWVGHSLLHEIRDLEGFLHKVAYNKAMDFFKVTSRHARLQQVYLSMHNDTIVRTAEENLIDAEYIQLLNEAINQLPPKRKEIYKLSREEGLTYDQIAAVLKLSSSTVRNSMVAANKAISKFLRGKHTGDANLVWLFFFS